MKVWLGFVFFCLVTHSWCVMHWSPKWREKVRGGERQGIIQRSKGSCCLYVAAMKVNCVFVWSGVFSFRKFCWKSFLNGSKRNETGINIREFVQHKLSFATVGLWLHHRSARCRQECPRRNWMCQCLSVRILKFLDCSNFMTGIEQMWLSWSNLNQSMLHWAWWMEY